MLLLIIIAENTHVPSSTTRYSNQRHTICAYLVLYVYRYYIFIWNGNKNMYVSYKGCISLVQSLQNFQLPVHIGGVSLQTTPTASIANPFWNKLPCKQAGLGFKMVANITAVYVRFLILIVVGMANPLDTAIYVSFLVSPVNNYAAF